MANKSRAERFKQAILSAGTYEQMAFKTNISVSTLVRIASGKTEPKLIDAVNISGGSGQSLDWLTFGDPDTIKEEAIKEFPSTHCQDSVAAHRLIVHNLHALDKDDICAIARQVHALSLHSN